MLNRCQIGPPQIPMQVWWRNGAEFFQLWDYDPIANLYSATQPGIDTTRATVTAGPSTVFSIVGTRALSATGTSIVATTFSEYGGVAGGPQPELQFFIGPKKVAALSTAGLRVAAITEGSPSTGNVFQIYSSGLLVATLSSSGLTATQITEGSP